MDIRLPEQRDQHQHGEKYLIESTTTYRHVQMRSGYYWASEDMDVLGNPSIQLDQIDISGAANFTFALDLLTIHYNDWDDSDEPKNNIFFRWRFLSKPNVDSKCR